MSIYNILKAKFLIGGDATGNWGFILFCTILAIFMIASSHAAEKKVHDIARLNDQVKELRSEFVDGRVYLMRLKMESVVTPIMEARGLMKSENPPIKLVVNQKE